MTRHKRQSNATLLAKLEQLIGAALPADYRSFMLDGRVLPKECVFEVIGPRDRYWSSLNALWPLRGRHVSVARGWGLLQGRESHLLIIGDDGTCNYICLAVRGSQRGKVFFVDTEYEPGEGQRVVKLADSFQKLINGRVIHKQ